ncbi:hypothetical protein CN572_24565 [Bacillus wiedmannii]|nr:hypothetical protein CN572_24565 [Bacillus wiedmannii]
MLPFFALVSSRSEQATSTFFNLVPAARMFGGFASSCEAKSASTSEAPSPSHSERAASTFFIVIQTLLLLPFRRRYTLLRYRIVGCGVSFRE